MVSTPLIASRHNDAQPGAYVSLLFPAAATVEDVCRRNKRGCNSEKILGLLVRRKQLNELRDDHSQRFVLSQVALI
jgi:hypothetical protein